jgi:hypothetical protein
MQKEPKKSRQTRMPPAVLPAHAHELYYSLKFHFYNVMESWRFCFVIFENSEGANFFACLHLNRINQLQGEKEAQEDSLTRK